MTYNREARKLAVAAHLTWRPGRQQGSSTAINQKIGMKKPAITNMLQPQHANRPSRVSSSEPQTGCWYRLLCARLELRIRPHIADRIHSNYLHLPQPVNQEAPPPDINIEVLMDWINAINPTNVSGTWSMGLGSAEHGLWEHGGWSLAA
ncbi:hypothetical protein VOLCADRAFT_90896 [Volvox carteri f. nagariensis]|uniref:Uncharacterized protein n=1 Tax=Volvox carteri f. nagariensis TaxID=3068 RepID=D8TVC6_VOLCA|nr:uncharacterized protein VOLCADRAFT_90896 [Volvox carteri f. nagariensis]EFJ48677.1 hypothetical protein VOLCADRAFT_90896 [Volvox carteri f. nagariensis]|eukprot:XP_002950476.1 hypothetical protein VOLCADRAFT_90896 [Volvox carteri f. nagariensis]